MANHAGDAQAALRNHAMVIEMPPMKVGVGDDGAACHFIEGDVLGRQVRGARHDHGVAHALRVLQRPAQRLHAAQRAAHHRCQGCDSQCIEQARLGVDPVFHRNDREISPIDAPRVGVDVHRTGGTKAGAQVIDADHKELVGV